MLPAPMRSSSWFPRFGSVGAAILAVSVFGCATTSRKSTEPAADRVPACTLASFSKLPDVALTWVTMESTPVSHCKVAGVIGPEIHFELLLPQEWNGKFVMGGGGGFVGSVMNIALLYGALESGYATVGTDTGHEGHPLDASWALHRPDRLVNFGHQAVHRTAVAAKALITAHYGRGIARNYFVGCSRGGGQALMEAQRYPEDFEGIVAGAPAYDWTNGLGAGPTQINQHMYPDPKKLDYAVISPEQEELIGSRILAECDHLDGLEDGILNDPRQCTFDVDSLACGRGQTKGCLGDAQLRAAKAIYDGPQDSEGKSLFPGFPFGGERSPMGWSRWLTGGLGRASSAAQFHPGAVTSDYPVPVVPSTLFGFGQGVMKYFIYQDPSWSYVGYRFDRFREDAAAVAATLNATDPDLSAFRRRGGKLLMYTGWSDMAITALGTIAYYDEVVKHDSSAAEDVRLFMMPGVDHCAGGVGPSYVNFLDQIDGWVEAGAATDEIEAHWLDRDAKPSGSRLLCAYPKVAEYDGAGDPRAATSFRCAEPK
jgi:feruloyl esterase